MYQGGFTGHELSFKSTPYKTGSSSGAMGQPIFLTAERAPVFTPVPDKEFDKTFDNKSDNELDNELDREFDTIYKLNKTKRDEMKHPPSIPPRLAAGVGRMMSDQKAEDVQAAVNDNLLCCLCQSFYLFT